MNDERQAERDRQRAWAMQQFGGAKIVLPRPTQSEVRDAICCVVQGVAGTYQQELIASELIDLQDEVAACKAKLARVEAAVNDAHYGSAPNSRADDFGRLHRAVRAALADSEDKP